MTPASLAAALAVAALATAAGLPIVRLCGGDRSFGETAGWSWGAGTLVLTGAYAALLAAGAQPGPKKLLLVLVLAAASGLLRKGRSTGDARTKPDVLEAVFAALAAAGCAAYFLQAVAEPLWSTDFLAIWGLKGKTIYFTGSVPARLFHDPATFWSHPDYPLFVPLAMAAFSSAWRSWNDETLGVLWAAWQIAAVLVVAGYGRRRGAPRAAFAAAALVAFFHPLYRGYGTGLADVPFAFAALLLVTAAADRNPGRAGIAALLAASTKQEGTLLAILVSAALLFGVAEDRRERRRTATVIAAVAAGHFVLLRALRGPVANRDFTLAPLSHPAELAARLARLVPGIAAIVSRPLVVAIAACAAVYACGRRSREDLLLAALVLQIGAYLSAAVFSAWDPVWQLQGVFRTAGALVPASAALLAARVGIRAETALSES